MPAFFVLDFVPNASAEQMKERMEAFYHIIRSKHPATPVIFIEDPIFTHTLYDERIAKEVQRKNDTLKEIFNRLKKENEKNIIFNLFQKYVGRRWRSYYRRYSFHRSRHDEIC